jgi:predicted phage terminase large subunit-like protein
MSLALSIPTEKQIRKADRVQLETYYRDTYQTRDGWIRKQVLENNRIDILAIEVLGKQIEPFHLSLLKYQFAHPENLQLCFRGAGKSTVCTEIKTIHLLLKNPNLRILIASKTIANAKGFLKNIKSHFETNQRLEEIFGQYYDPRRVGKWDEVEIEVLPRTIVAKEASVTCVGVEGTVVSKHYDIIISDDLIDEENSRSKLQRDKTRTWFYNTLMPTLEPPDPEVEHRGEHHMLGTRYHYDDLYGHLIDNELKEHHQIIPALDNNGRSPWPKKFSPKWFAEKRKRSGLIIFNCQYQCDTEAMKGEIFQYDQCQQISEEEWPDHKNLRVFMGVDLAISESESADKFAIVVIGINRDRSAYYVLDYYENQLRFKEQTKKILEYYRRWRPIRCAIETNQYQAAQYQTLKEKNPDIRLKKVQTDKDKITRAWKLSSIFEDNRVFFRKGIQALLIEHMVLFPNHRYKDLFDAFDLSVQASKMKRKRRRRETEPGVM